MSREIEFNYLCKHTYKGIESFYSKTLSLDEIEKSTDIIEDIGNEIDVSCNCFNESCNHCECNTIFDFGEFDIIAKRQFTGLLDCNGVKIFEGDILSVMVQELSDKPPKTGIKELDECKPKKGEKFHTGKKIPAIWTIEHVNHLTYTGFKFYGLNRRFNKVATRSMIYNNQVKVIGNIHQNIELLK